MGEIFGVVLNGGVLAGFVLLGALHVLLPVLIGDVEQERGFTVGDFDFVQNMIGSSGCCFTVISR